MIRKIVRIKGILQADPELLEKKIVFFNFDRDTNMDKIKEGDEWIFKTTSNEISINKTDKKGRKLVYMYVLPVRRSEKWVLNKGRFDLVSGDNKISDVAAKRKVDKIIVFKNKIQEVGEWINPISGRRDILLNEIDNLEDISPSLKDRVEKVRSELVDGKNYAEIKM